MGCGLLKARRLLGDSLGRDFGWRRAHVRRRTFAGAKIFAIAIALVNVTIRTVGKRCSRCLGTAEAFPQLQRYIFVD